MLDFNEDQDWHRFKDEEGPTLSGSRSWRRYVEFLEKMKEYGVVVLEKNKGGMNAGTSQIFPITQIGV